MKIAVNAVFNPTGGANTQLQHIVKYFSKFLSKEKIYSLC